MKHIELLDMKLHDILEPNIGPHCQILCVPGGWIYRFFQPMGEDDYSCDSVFVPWSTT